MSGILGKAEHNGEPLYRDPAGCVAEPGPCPWRIASDIFFKSSTEGIGLAARPGCGGRLWVAPGLAYQNVAAE